MTASPAINPLRIRRIAIFRALYLGDLLLSVPAWRAIRRRFPQAEITLISLPWAQDFAAQFPHYIDRFVPFTGYPGFHEAPGTPESVARFLEEQRGHAYDVAIQMHGSGAVSNRLIAQLGARITAGLYAFDRPASLTLAGPYPEDQPEICRNLRLAALLGCDTLDPALDFPLLLQDRREAVRLLGGRLDGDRPLAVLHPGSKTPSRRWPAERFAALGNLLAVRYDAAVILTGSAAEAPLAAVVAGAMDAPALNLAGRTTLGGLAALLSLADLVIANDTGPAHLAEAVGSSVITIHGPGDIARWAPLDRARFPIVRVPVPCSPCEYFDCPIDHRCLTRVTVDRVLAAAEPILARKTVPCDA